jgi:Flp pilus assembly protein TadD
MDDRSVEEVIAEKREAIQSAPDSSRAHAELAHILINAGRFDEAIAVCHEAVRLDRSNYPLFFRLGCTLQEAAIAAYREVIRAAPDEAGAHKLTAIGLADTGFRNEATAEIKEAIRLEPGNALLYAHLGLYHEEDGEADGAITAWREAVRLDPNNLHFRVSLGYTLNRAGRTHEAREVLRGAAHLLGADPREYRRWGGALLAAGLSDEARAAWVKALRLERAEVTEDALEKLTAFYSQIGSGD